MNLPADFRNLARAVACGVALWMGLAQAGAAAGPGAETDGNRFEHADCWLRYRSGYAGPFTGANPSPAELFEALRALSARYRVPLEMLGAVCFQESTLCQYGSDGFVVHNLGECIAQYYGATGTPPGLGLMQLTGATAKTYDLNRLITDWRYNLEAGVQILRHKYAVVLGRAPPALQRIELAHWAVLENWRYALAGYNGFRYPENPYVETVCGHIAHPPAPLAGLYAGVPVARPAEIIPGFVYGQDYAVTPLGAWHDGRGGVHAGVAHRGRDLSALIPFPGCAGDYDGDRLADPARCDPTDGAWRVLCSAAGYAAVSPNWRLGGPGWSAAPADYDGDGRADPAVYRESGGAWQAALSSTGYRPHTLDDFPGVPGVHAVPADYDGDRLADPAGYTRADGTWELLLSSSRYSVRLRWPAFLGGPGWMPAPADYDGDGLADPAVCAADGVRWRVARSGSGYAPLSVSLPGGAAP